MTTKIAFNVKGGNGKSITRQNVTAAMTHISER
jgi:nitrogenase subunit NifH